MNENMAQKISSLIDRSMIENLNLSGKGGKEKILHQTLLCRWNRVNKPLYDFIYSIGENEIKLEVKKQQNLQWFDLGKYHNLSKENRNICMLFVISNKEGVITHILTCFLCEFVDWMCANKQEDGWNKDVIRTTYLWKQDYPRLQTKAPVKILNLYKKIPELFHAVYIK